MLPSNRNTVKSSICNIHINQVLGQIILHGEISQCPMENACLSFFVKYQAPQKKKKKKNPPGLCQLPTGFGFGWF